MNRFKEMQVSNQWWLILMMVSLNVVIVSMIFFSYESYLQEKLLLTVICLASTSLIFIFKLDTQIDEEGISYRFFPIHIKFKKVKWDKLSEVNVREYSPIGEYGGWGIRYGNNGWAYNIRGNKGIQMKLKNGSKVLIGTQQSTKAETILNKYGIV